MIEQSKKILVVEDEKSMAKAMKLKLTKAGFDVHVVHNGEEAFSMVEKGGFDLIITDLVMPRLDGFGLLIALKEKGINTPVIVTSNLSQPEDESKAKELGAIDYFIKSNTPIIEIINYAKKALQ